MTDFLGPFAVDPGSAPSGEPAAQPSDGRTPGGQAAGAGGAETPADLLELDAPIGPVGVEQVEHLLSAMWAVCRYTVGRGVPGAFEPTDAELREQARPTAAVLGRSARAAAVAQQGDAIGMVMHVGGYAAGELATVRAYRQAEADAIAGGQQPPAAAVEDDGLTRAYQTPDFSAAAGG